MRKTTTFIKLDRNILDWGWYQDANTFRVFIHLLLKANVKDHYFKGTMVKRGSVATSYGSIGKSLTLTPRQVRTAIEHLKMTNEVSSQDCGSFLLVSILSYDRYQTKSQVTSHSEVTQKSNDTSNRSQQSKNIKNKETRSDVINETSDAQKARIERLRNS